MSRVRQGCYHCMYYTVLEILDNAIRKRKQTCRIGKNEVKFYFQVTGNTPA